MLLVRAKIKKQDQENFQKLQFVVMCVRFLRHHFENEAEQYPKTVATAIHIWRKSARFVNGHLTFTNRRNIHNVIKTMPCHNWQLD